MYKTNLISVFKATQCLHNLRQILSLHNTHTHIQITRAYIQLNMLLWLPSDEDNELK